MKPDYVIAIDPDCDKSGVAKIDVLTRKIELKSLQFPQLLEYLYSESMTAACTCKVLKVYVEAGWENRSHWHVRSGDTVRQASRKGNDAGRNHEVGRKIIEMAQHYGMDVTPVKPLEKSWSGPGKKITHEEISRIIPGFPAKSNQETRDAALLGWVKI